MGFIIQFRFISKKLIKISDIKQSPIRHAVLPDGFIERIRTFKQTLADVENTSLEQAVSNFQRDMHPENELRIWEHIAKVYQTFVSKNAVTDLATKKEIYSVALATSMGIEDFNNVKLLSKDQIKNLVFLYRE